MKTLIYITMRQDGSHDPMVDRCFSTFTAAAKRKQFLEETMVPPLFGPFKCWLVERPLDLDDSLLPANFIHPWQTIGGLALERAQTLEFEGRLGDDKDH